MSSFMFESWTGLLRVLLVGPLAYAALVLILRVSGKRTLSKFNAFDFVVTIALGLTLATILLNIRTFAARQCAGKKRADLAGATRGQCSGALRRQRVTTDEVDAAVRSAGLSGIENVANGANPRESGSFHIVERRRVVVPAPRRQAPSNARRPDLTLRAEEQLAVPPR